MRRIHSIDGFQLSNRLELDGDDRIFRSSSGLMCIRPKDFAPPQLLPSSLCDV